MIRIYLLTCIANDKRFIGFTQEKHNLARIRHRLATDAKRFGSSGNSPLLADVLSYGISNFSLSHLERCEDEQRLCRVNHWIVYFNTLRPTGYNRHDDHSPNHQEPTP